MTRLPVFHLLTSQRSTQPRTTRSSELLRSFNFGGLGLITSRLLLQFFNDRAITNLARQFQTKFRFGAKMRGVTHALLRRFAF